MLTGWHYRFIAIGGVVGISVVAVIIANVRPVQFLFTTYTPVFWRLDPVVLSNSSLYLAIALTVASALAVLVPLYKPGPRRAMDTFFMAQKRMIVAGCVLATLGYFNYSFRLPRTTLTISIGLLTILLPLWFVWIRQIPEDKIDRALLVGDDPQQITDLIESTDIPYVGYLAPPQCKVELDQATLRTDGGDEVRRIGGLARTEDILVGRAIDTAILAFEHTDRGEFFGVLDACYDQGVNAKVHGQFAEAVLTDGITSDILHDVTIEPLDFQDYLAKRSFDVLFAGLGLLVFAPIMLVIALAIKLDDGGSVFYHQSRTTGFGDSFVTWKFRTMTEKYASAKPTEDHERITRVGAVLREVHLDEVPQLYSILLGRMSVVGPRAVWVEEENIIEADVDPDRWRQRWFVKPGLTGLAQINDVDSSDPEQKLRYDLEYIRRQSLWLDINIVLLQIWQVWSDLLEGIASLVLRRRSRDDSREQSDRLGNR